MTAGSIGCRTDHFPIIPRWCSSSAKVTLRGSRIGPIWSKPGVAIITPNPKTSGNGYLSFFAAWGSVVLRGGSRQDAIDYVTRLYQQVPVLDSGARRGHDDLRSEARSATYTSPGRTKPIWKCAEAKGNLDLIYPPISIRAEPHVAVVDANVDRKGTREVAEAYLKFAYTDEGQEIIARHYYRPSNESMLQKHANSFPNIRLFKITEIAKDFQMHTSSSSVKGAYSTRFMQSDQLHSQPPTGGVSYIPVSPSVLWLVAHYLAFD